MTKDVQEHIINSDDDSFETRKNYQLNLIRKKMNQLVKKLEEKGLTELYLKDIHKAEKSIKSIEKIR